jgi:hypothetical protein
VNLYFKGGEPSNEREQKKKEEEERKKTEGNTPPL